MSNYARAFRVVRAFRGWQQSEAAGRLGLSASALSLIENGKRRPSIGVIDKLSKEAGVRLTVIALLAEAATPEESEALKALVS